MLGRALRRRCPRCGDPCFQTWFQMKEHCDRCGLQFEREPGYWVGAVIINTTLIFGTFLLTFGGLVIATWPDVNWGLVLGVTIAVNGIVPVVFYPLSKTVWMAMELSWHPLEPAEIDAAADRVKGA